MDPITTAIRILTYAGLIPLLVLNCLCLLVGLTPWDQWLITYTAIIISFIAGMQWGISLELERSIWVLLLSIFGSLWGWFTLLFNTAITSLILQIIGMIFLYVIDTKLIPEDAYPVQYLVTRRRATGFFITFLIIQILIQLYH